MAKTNKKAPAPKSPKEAKPKKEAGIILSKDAVHFVSFEFGAVIPTQSFGNVQPRIVVEAPSFEEAAAFAIPKIEALYAKYAEVKPEFLGKITETVKEVAPAPTAPVAAVSAPAAPQAQDVPAPAPTGPVQPQATASSAPVGPKPDAVAKAERAIAAAATEQVAFKVQDQIEKSTKIDAAWKPYLLELCLKKRNTFGKPE